MGARSLAVVSGKGGSGKTLVVTALAQSLAYDGHSVLMVDVDLGTGGLTYYLGFSEFQRARDGIVELLSERANFSEVSVGAKIESLIENKWLTNVKLIPIGDHNDVIRNDQLVGEIGLEALIETAKEDFDYVIFDCRGGIDADSLTVCSSVDEILIVAETDAASIQATQHLSQILYERSFGNKMSGFALNKVMDDPTALAQAGRTFFKCEYLGAIPMDIETTRRFIRGKVPEGDSLFSRHVGRIAEDLFNLKKSFGARVLNASDFADTFTRGPSIRNGRFVWLFICMYFFTFLILIFEGAEFYEPAYGGVYLGRGGIYILASVFFVVIVGLLSDRFMESMGAYFRKILKLFGRWFLGRNRG